MSHTPQDMLYDLFRKSDKDENGYLTGYEFDVYQSKANGNVYEADYRRLMEEKERNASNHKDVEITVLETLKLQTALIN